jgi:hypothetical protein
MLGLFWWIDRWRTSEAYMALNAAEQGMYRNLLDEAWLRKGLLPLDDAHLAAASGHPLEWPAGRAKILACFTRSESGYRHTTLDAVLHQSKRRKRNQAAYYQRVKPGLNAGLKPVSQYTGSYKEHSSTAAPGAPLFPHPVEISTGPPEEHARATPWKRIVAICHAVMDALPDRSDWSHEVKARGTAQGLPIYERSGKDKRELWARALDYTDNARQVRASRGR